MGKSKLLKLKHTCCMVHDYSKIPNWYFTIPHFFLFNIASSVLLLPIYVLYLSSNKFLDSKMLSSFFSFQYEFVVKQTTRTADDRSGYRTLTDSYHCRNAFSCCSLVKKAQLRN